MDTKPAPKFRELFIEELAEVQGGTGGGPCDSSAILSKLGACNTTMACCEEGNDGCCA